MSDPRDEIRRLIDSAEPVTDAEARAVAAAGGEDVDVLAGEPGRSDRRPLVLAAAAAVIVLLIAGLFAWRQPDDDTVTTGPTTTTLGPPTTVLAPIGDDPLVSCDPHEPARWFPLSAWSEPPGAENDPDPASQALRAYLDFRQRAYDEGLIPDSPVFPSDLPDTWRRLSETDDLVVFGAGELNPADLPAEPGPVLTFVQAELVDGSWQAGEMGGGTCNRLSVYPGDDNSVANWWVPEEDRPVDPATTELRIQVSDSFPCDRPFGVEHVLGPDVVETPTSVTIRVALALPPVDVEDCLTPRGVPPEQTWLDVTVPLRSPLGDRQVLDAGEYPARPVDLQPQPPERQPVERPRIELPGGAIEQDVEIVLSTDQRCDYFDPTTCSVPTAPGQITVAVGDDTVTGSTNEHGWATLVLPDAPVEVRTESEGMDCPNIRILPPHRSLLRISCTRLDSPHATVGGRMSATADQPWLLAFGSVLVGVESDGTFEVVLEPGTWTLSLMDAGGTQRCTVGPDRTIEVVAGVDQTLDLTCT